MSDDTPDDELLSTYRLMSTRMLKESAVAFALDLVDAQREGPELEAFCQRRLDVITRVLEERGEVKPVGRMF